MHLVVKVDAVERTCSATVRFGVMWRWMWWMGQGSPKQEGEVMHVLTTGILVLRTCCVAIIR